MNMKVYCIIIFFCLGRLGCVVAQQVFCWSLEILGFQSSPDFGYLRNFHVLSGFHTSLLFLGYTDAMNVSGWLKKASMTHVRSLAHNLKSRLQSQVATCAAFFSFQCHCRAVFIMWVQAAFRRREATFCYLVSDCQVTLFSPQWIKGTTS